MTPPPRSRPRAALPGAALLVTLSSLVVALVVALVVPLLALVAPAQASSSYLCTGYTSCAQAGYSHFGYKSAGEQMWWRMYSGHNCTNYVAYRLIKNGMSEERPWDSTGMAYNWGRANRSITDQTPMVGAVAWWEAGDGVGSSGHVAYVQKVVSNRKIVISEDSWSGDFHWRTITKDGSGWPTGFIHFQDREVTVAQRPQVTGTPRIGQTLTADTGTWKPAASYAVQWLSGREPIAGATGTTLDVTKALLRTRLSVRVTAKTNGYVPGSATSERTTKVRRGQLEVATRPSISGTPQVDEVLVLDPGAASPAAESRTVRWYADGEQIAGADGLRLRLSQEQIRSTITATVVHSRDGYANLAATSAPTEPVAAGQFEVSDPFTVSGQPRVGRTLTVEPGTFTPQGASVSYTWLRGGQVVEGATGATYDVGAADLGKQLSVQVDLRHPGYQDTTLTADADGPTTTVPDLVVDATGRVRKVVVTLGVTAPGVDGVSGPATVRVEGREATGRVVDGRLRLVVKGVTPGRHQVQVEYAGTEVVEAASGTDRVRVTRR